MTSSKDKKEEDSPPSAVHVVHNAEDNDKRLSTSTIEDIGSILVEDDDDDEEEEEEKETKEEVVDENIPDMSLLSITEGENERGIPIVKFIEDVGAFAESFTPAASAELLIGAYSELHSKFKTYETSLSQKYQNFQSKIPEIEQSLLLIKNLMAKKDDDETLITRYSLADDVYGKAELDLQQGSVNLWLGANVMLEYTYQEAIDFLSSNEAMAKKEFEEVKTDLAFVRDQIVTSEVGMSRIFNWDVRRKRALNANTTAATATATAATATTTKEKEPQKS